MQEIIHSSDLNLITVKLTGIMFYDDSKKIWRDTIKLIQNSDTHAILIDARRHKALDFEGNVWLKEEFLEEVHNVSSKQIRIAIIVSKRQNNRHELPKMLHYMREKGANFKVKVFPDCQDGIEWLQNNLEMMPSV